MTKTAKALTKARNLIDTLGLHKGSLEQTSNGPFCMMGAINKVSYSDSSFSFGDMMEAVYTVLGYRDIPKFNDSTKTNKQLVLKKFDEAISLELSNEL